MVGVLGDLGKIVTRGGSPRSRPGDKRFTDPAWKTSGCTRRSCRATSPGPTPSECLCRESRPRRTGSRARANLIAGILVDALAPTNGLFSNPAALKKIVDTGGESLWSGVKNYVEDLVKNGGMPSQVDDRPFKVGKNVATTPGVGRFSRRGLRADPVSADDAEVWRAPARRQPPQINKFYSLDLSPEKSMIQFLLWQGVQVFCISWRNPGRSTATGASTIMSTSIRRGRGGRAQNHRKRGRLDDGRVLGRHHVLAYAACQAGRGRLPGEEPDARGLHARSLDGRRTRRSDR